MSNIKKIALNNFGKKQPKSKTKKNRSITDEKPHPLRTEIIRKSIYAHDLSNDILEEISKNKNEFNTKDKDISNEIKRRVSLVKFHLISDLLSASGNYFSINEFLNHISALIQLPILALIYRIENSSKTLKAKWVSNFNFGKMRESRGSLQLFTSNVVPIEESDPPDVVIKNTDSFFQIFNTNFYLKIYLLDTGAGIIDGPFVEVKSKNQNYKLAQPDVIGVSDKYRSQAAYIEKSLNRLLKWEESDYQTFGYAFLKEKIEYKISNTLNQAHYQSIENRKSITLSSKKEVIAPKIRISYLNYAANENSGLDRIYNRAEFSSNAISWMGSSGEEQLATAADTHQNMLFSLRTYDRENVRCENSIGYTHNVFFIIPKTQRKHLIEQFTRLKNTNRCSTPGVCDEFFGGDRTTETGWQFENEKYYQLAKSIDDEFWNILIQKPFGIKYIIKTILSTAVGDNTVSFADPIFYYGSSLYRMPFRREGGLKRIKGLENLVNSPSPVISFSDVKDEATRRDCLRVVAFFYLTGFLGPKQINRSRYWTKLILFPLSVAGAVVGSLSSVSYEKKHFDDVDIVKDAHKWNQEFFFFSRVVAAAQNSLRQQYRDFQAKQLSNCLQNISDTIFSNKSAKSGVTILHIESIVSALNAESINIARVCPYPYLIFQRLESSDEYNEWVLKIGTFKIKFTQVLQEFNIFRSSSTTGNNELHFENDFLKTEILQSIKVKLQETIVQSISRNYDKSTLEKIKKQTDNLLKTVAESSKRS